MKTYGCISVWKGQVDLSENLFIVMKEITQDFTLEDFREWRTWYIEKHKYDYGGFRTYLKKEA